LPSATNRSRDPNEVYSGVVLETQHQDNLQNRHILLMRAFAAIWLATAASASASAGHIFSILRRNTQTDICFRSHAYQLKPYVLTHVNLAK